MLNKGLGLRAAFISAAIAAVAFAWFFAAYPIQFPFVDDWRLVPYGTGDVPLTFASLFAVLNGHQHLFIKLFCYVAAQLAHFSFPGMAYVGTLCGVLGFAFIVATMQARRPRSFWITLGALLFLLNLKQMQNFFLLICLPWMFALLFMGLFLYLYNRFYTQVSGALVAPRHKLLLVTLCLLVLGAPFTTGMGLIVPLFCAAFTLLAGFRRQGSWLLFITSGVSIAVSMVMPKILAPVYNLGDVPLSKEVGYVLGHPFQALQMLLGLIGQPWFPWLESTLGAAIATGALGLGLLFGLGIYAWRKSALVDRRMRAADLVLDTAPLWFAFLFMGLAVLARTRELGLVGALEPRYTTGAVLFWVGLIPLVQTALRGMRGRTTTTGLGMVVLGLALWANWRAGPSGLNYYFGRYDQSVAVRECYRKHAWRLDDECNELGYPGAWFDRAEYLRLLQHMRERRLAVFSLATE